MRDIRHFRSFLGAIALCVSLGAVAEGIGAQSSRSVPEIKVDRPPFREVVNRVIPTSGNGVVGVQSGSLLAAADTSMITVGGIKSSDATICVNIEHSNGSYLASFRVDNPQIGSTIRFELPSQLLRNFKVRSGELAILARASSGATCGSRSSILSASWGRSSSTEAGFILINDTQADIVRVSVDGGAAQSCRKLRTVLGQNNVFRSFQTACPIPASTSECRAERRVVVQLVTDGEFDSLRLALRSTC